MAVLRCPTCGAELGGRSICMRCGTLAAAEFKLAHIQHKTRRFFDERIAAIPRNLRAHHFLWACALMPIFLLPPLVSLAASLAAMRRGGEGAGAHHFEWIAIISVLNIVISVAILYKFHFSPSELLAVARDFLRALLGSIFHLAPGQQPSSPRVIPI